MENALAVANYFIHKAQETNDNLTPMKLVKLVYIANGIYLGLKDEPLIDEAVQAWKYGPVIPSVYHTFKIYGGQKITSPATILPGINDTEYALRDKGLEPFLDKVWGVYGKFDGIYLSAITHQSGTPWSVTWSTGGSIRRETVIDNSLISSHYKELLSK